MDTIHFFKNNGFVSMCYVCLFGCCSVVLQFIATYFSGGINTVTISFAYIHVLSSMKSNVFKP